MVDADLLTVFGDAGSRTDRRRYVVETRLPSLDLPLVEGEEVLSLSVDGNPARPQHDGDTLVVALPSSRAPRRTVEVVSKSKGDLPPKKGEVTVVQRPLGAVATIARWAIVLPDDRRYRIASTEGIRKVAWMRDEPVVATRYSATRERWAEARPNLPPPPVNAPSVSGATGFDNSYVVDGVSIGDKGDNAKKVEGGVEGGVAGGVMGGVLAPSVAPSAPATPAPKPEFLDQRQAGIRSLPMEVKGQGKRLLLSGPLIGAEPLRVKLEVEPK